MDIGILIGVIGVLVSIGIAYFEWRRRKRKTPEFSLLFYERDHLFLFKDIIKNIDNLRVSYKESPVRNNALLLKFSIINNGISDIDRPLVYEELKVVFPEHFTVLNANIAHASERVKCSIKSIDNCIILDWDILKVREFISIDVLVEIDEEVEGSVLKREVNVNRLERWYGFDFRIKNIDRIKVRSLMTPSSVDFLDEKRIVYLVKALTWSFILSFSFMLFAYGWELFLVDRVGFGKHFNYQTVHRVLFMLFLSIALLSVMIFQMRKKWSKEDVDIESFFNELRSKLQGEA